MNFYELMNCQAVLKKNGGLDRHHKTQFLKSHSIIRKNKMDFRTIQIWSMPSCLNFWGHQAFLWDH